MNNTKSAAAVAAEKELARVFKEALRSFERQHRSAVQRKVAEEKRKSLRK